MGDFADKLKEWHHSDEMVTTVAKAEEIAALVSGASAYYGAAQAIGAELGLWGGKPDQFAMLQEAIKAIKQAIDEAVATLLETSYYEEVDALARTHLILSTVAVQAMDLLYRVQRGEMTEEEIRDELVLHTDPAQYLENSAWVVTPFAGAYHEDPWSGQLPPNLVGGRLFMFSIVTPGYLNALVRWLTALAAVFPDPFTDDILLKRHAERLVELHELWLSGLETLRIPTLDEFLPPPPSLPPWPHPGQYWTLRQPQWDLAGRRWGAVDTFTAVASIDTYDEDRPTPPDPRDYPFHFEGQPPPDPNDPNRTPPSNPNAPDQPKLVTDDYLKAYEAFRAEVAAHIYPRVVRRLRAIGLRERKVVYNQVGLPGMWRMQNWLRSLMGTATIRPSGSPGHWSLREFAGEVGADGLFADLIESMPRLDLFAGHLTARTPNGAMSVRELAHLMDVPDHGSLSLRAIFLDPEQRVP